MTEEELRSAIRLGHEVLGVEFKGPGARDDTAFFAKVVRAALGMANRRDGGTVVVGVAETDAGPQATGLTAEQLASWNYDDVAAGFARYADPSLTFELGRVRLDGHDLVVLTVQPFGDVPVLCKQEYSRPREGRTEVILRRGACYVRSRGRVETVDVSTVEDMRDLLDLATERRLAAFVAQAARAGLSLAPGVHIPVTDADRYAAERGAPPDPLPGSRALVADVLTRGYWQCVVRPEAYEPERVPDLHALRPILARAAVSLGGWSFPLLRSEQLPDIGMRHIEQGLDWEHRREWWAFYQSGQLVQLAGVPEDWRDRSTLWPAPSGWQAGRLLGVADTIWRFTAAFESAARLAVTAAGDDPVRVELSLHGARDRVLYVDAQQDVRRFDFTYTAALEVISYARTLPRAELLAGPRDHALAGAREVFSRFGWQPSIEVLRDWQVRS